jgi:protocatechuate 3,4-dioxygenase beta subunit
MATTSGRNAIPGALLVSCLVAPAMAASDPRMNPDLRKAPATAWDVQLGAAGDPGERFEMSGIVRGPDGKPLAGRKVFFYHADSHGRYAEGDSPMRFAAALRTDAQGRYRIRTKFPGGYGGFAAHVHFELLEPGLVAGTVNVRRENQEGQGLAAKRGKDGIWRLEVDLKP